MQPISPGHLTEPWVEPSLFEVLARNLIVVDARDTRLPSISPPTMSELQTPSNATAIPPPQGIAADAIGRLAELVALIFLKRPARLPPELIDWVIDSLHDDRATLKTCALVCRSWVPTSRHHLSSYLVISTETRQDLIAILCSTSCMIGPAVRELTLA
jgi:hypothetical protein